MLFRTLFIWLFLVTSANATEYCVKKVVDCKGKTSALCTEDIIIALGHNGTSVKLKADTKTDKVNGHVTIQFLEPPKESTICVTYYDTTELANSKHATKLEKLNNIPSSKNVQDALATLIIP